MAHYFQIPFSFEFRTRSVEWAYTAAHLTGWAVGADGARDSLHLIAQISDGKGEKSIKLGLSDFPGGEKKTLLAALKRVKGEVEKQVFSSVELNVFVPANRVPIVDRELKKHTQPADAWQMRDDFLRMTASQKDVQAFLCKWGRWHQTRNYAEMREMFALQRAVRDGLIVSPEGWFATGYAFLPRVSSSAPEFPYFAMLTDVCRDAICIATTIDLLRQVEFKVCARRDCELPFRVTSKHAKAYCSQYCGHLESVRRGRKPKTAKQKVGA